MILIFLYAICFTWRSSFGESCIMAPPGASHLPSFIFSFRFKISGEQKGEGGGKKKKESKTPRGLPVRATIIKRSQVPRERDTEGKIDPENSWPNLSLFFFCLFPSY
ncbi:hypothetical protein B0T24DRAFT_348419 [Lasiosphaeria ovina]|uniref:Secreted protein n=1 Tax=Lasiosphaeria ovina TaxID=92902 RepID=A0AAE0K2U6_9PEZI|nr:hypothetical protein B0T24DRAFT_348419 [Lasiosphaeria ovina]